LELWCHLAFLCDYPPFLLTTLHSEQIISTIYYSEI
jgi:hypothetical protein